MTKSPATKQWYFGNWSGLGWLETVIKLIAFIAAISALINATSSSEYATLNGIQLIQVVVLGILAFGLTLGIIDRYNHREIIAMVFILINNVAHWGMVYALLKVPGPSSLLLIFAGLMHLGDWVKIYWLWVSGYTQDGYPQWLMYVLTGSFVVGYAIILLLALVS